MRVHTIAAKIILLCLLSLNASATSDKEITVLLGKYEEVMNQQKVELVDEVFTQDFLKGHGGKEEFVKKVKTLPFEKKKKGVGLFLQKLKKSKVGKFFSVKAKTNGTNANEFIIKSEDGKLKIDGTVSDG